MNGLGPWWWPAAWRANFTAWASRWFVTASWDRHDEGYGRGHPSRAECDRRFLGAMLLDAGCSATTFKMAGCTIIAWAFWGAVRIGGWASYRKNNEIR